MFTVPSGGAGLYYFYVHVLVSVGEEADFRLEKNHELLCGLLGDNSAGGARDYDTGTCAATVMLDEGNKIITNSGNVCNP